MVVSTPYAARSLPQLSTFLLYVALMNFTAGCSVFGVEKAEEAPYQLVQKDKQFEIRDYAPLVVAETRVTANYKEAGSKAFRTLFAYISGENEASEKIAMTAPVIAESNNSNSGESIAMTAPITAQKEQGAWRYSFVLPNTYSLKSAPRPLNPEVTLAEIPKKRVATIRYSGRMTEKALSKNAEALAKWIESKSLISLSEPRWAGYNAPWTLPPFRRNEVLIDVSDQ